MHWVSLQQTLAGLAAAEKEACRRFSAVAISLHVVLRNSCRILTGKIITMGALSLLLSTRKLQELAVNAAPVAVP